MFKFIGAMLLFVLIGSWADAQDGPPAPTPLKLPPEVRGAPQTVIRIRADTNVQKVRWRSLDHGLTLLDRDDLRDQREMRAFACAAGRYRVVAWCAAGDDATELVETVVVVEGTPPPPAPPGPDTLAAALKTAYDAEAEPRKAEQVVLLAAVWREAVKYANTPQDQTLDALLTRIKTASASLVPPAALTGVRRRIAEELAAQLPATIDTPLDQPTRAKAAALFERIAKALEILK